VPLTSALSVNTATANVPLQFVFLTTTTDAQRTLSSGDSLRISMVTAGSVTVQPDDLNVNVELLVTE
jgi:uncharacterized protein YggE